MDEQNDDQKDATDDSIAYQASITEVESPSKREVRVGSKMKNDADVESNHESE